MKPKKAVKKLRKTQQSLSTLMGQWDDNKPEVHELLAAAEKSVSGALALIGSNASTTAQRSAAGRRKKAARASAKHARDGRFTAGRRKKLSVAAKKRWAAAKRRGARTLAQA